MVKANDATPIPCSVFGGMMTLTAWYLSVGKIQCGHTQSAMSSSV